MALRFPLIVAFALLFSPAASARGHLVLIGGGDKPDAAMKKFVELAGGPQSPIVVIPTASSEKDTGDYYVKLFREEHGCSDVTVLDVKNKKDASREDFVAAAMRARGIFFAGGDQLRIMVAFDRTPLLAAMKDAFERGAVIGGTSAGTACQSRLMITGEGNFNVIRSNAVELWNGLGFFPGVIVDQHFVARQRENRLFSVILEHPDQLGVGVDEDTAVWVRPDDTFEVIGENSVMVIDARDAAIRRPAGGGQELLGAHGLKVHILVAGEVFDLEKGAVVAPATAASVKP